MEKLLLLALVSLTLPCFGMPVRVKLVAHGDEPVYMVGDWYDEQNHTITTPFDFVNYTIQIICSGHEGAIVKEAADQPELLEFFEPVQAFDLDPTILRQAIALITEPGHDINELDQQTITWLINVYCYLGAPHEIIDLLVGRSAEFAVQDPAHCSFKGDYRMREGIEIPTPADDRVMIKNAFLIRAARKLVTHRFRREVLPHNRWSRILLPGHQEPIISAAWSPNGQHIATGSADNTVRIWGVNGLPEEILVGHQNMVEEVAWSPDGQYLATCSWDHTARIWGLDGELKRVLRGHYEAVVSVAWSPDGQHILTGSRDRTACVWNLNGKREHILVGHQQAILLVAWSPDGRHVATCSLDKTACIWSAEGKLLQELVVGSPFIKTLRWSPDGQHLAVAFQTDMGQAGEACSHIWNLHGILEHTLKGYSLSENSIGWSPDGSHRSDESDDQTDITWRANGLLEREVLGRYWATRPFAWSSDENHRVIGSGDLTTPCIWYHAWNFPSWPAGGFDHAIDYDGNLLKQLLMLKVVQNLPLSSDEIAALQPFYNQLPASARALVDERVHNAFAHV